MQKLSFGKRRSSAIPIRISITEASENSGPPRSRRFQSSNQSGQRTKSEDRYSQISTDRQQASVSKLKRSRSNLGTPQTPALVFGSVSSASKTVTKDVRPINDKQWQSAQFAKVSKFVQDTLGSYVIKPLTIKSFVEICQVLLKQVSPRVLINTTNYIEELPIILRKIGYPGKVTKSLLVSVNVPRNWPSALGILSYLVDFIGAIFHDYPVEIVSDENTERQFDIIVEAYHLFSSNKDYEHLGTEYAKLEANFGPINVDAVQSEIDCLQQDLQTFKDAEQVEEDLKVSNSKLLREIENMNQDLKQQESLLKKGQTQIELLHEQINKGKQFKETIKVDISDLDKIIQKQQITNADRDEKLTACVDLESDIKNICCMTDQLNDFSNNIDLEMSKNKQDMQVEIDHYNKLCLKYSMEFPEINSFATYNLRPLDPETYQLLLTQLQTMKQFLVDVSSKNNIIFQHCKESSLICEQLRESAAAKNAQLTNLKTEKRKLEEDIAKLAADERMCAAEYEQHKQIISEDMKKCKPVDITCSQKELKEIDESLVEIDNHTELLHERVASYNKKQKALHMQYVEDVSKTMAKVDKIVAKCRSHMKDLQ